MNLTTITLLLLYWASHLPFLESYHETALRQHLFKNYSSFARPLKDQSTCLNVTFNMRLIRLLSVEERNEKLASQAYYSVRWQNEFLKWTPSDWGGIRTLEVDPKMVWVPDIILKNNADSNTVTIQTGTDRVWIQDTGENSWYPKVMMISSFKADVTDFPFDNQKFEFHFGSWSLGKNKLQIVKDGTSMLDRYYLKSPEWELLRVDKEIVMTPYDSDTYSEILFIYCFSRKPMYSVVTSIVPSIMLMTIALSSFLLPPYNGERIKVLITALLAFTVFQVQINGSLPRNSDSIPIIQIFYMVTMGECILCFLTTCLLVRIFEKNKREHLPFNIPGWIKKHILRVKETQVKSYKVNEHPNIAQIPTCKYEIFPLEEQLQQLNGTTKASPNVLNTDIVLRSSFNSLCASRDDLTEDDGCKGGTKQNSNDMTWGMFVRHVDKVCLRVFSLLFFTTSVGILLPPYFRKYNSSMTK